MNLNGFCPMCGRTLRAHCPTCGSLRVYALASRNDKINRSDGTTAILKVWRCTRCANLFNDDDWQLRCQAPPERRAQPKERRPKNEPLRFNDVSEAPEAAQIALKEYLEKYAKNRS